MVCMPRLLCSQCCSVPPTLASLTEDRPDAHSSIHKWLHVHVFCISSRWCSLPDCGRAAEKACTHSITTALAGVAYLVHQDSPDAAAQSCMSAHLPSRQAAMMLQQSLCCGLSTCSHHTMPPLLDANQCPLPAS